MSTNAPTNGQDPAPRSRLKGKGLRIVGGVPLAVAAAILLAVFWVFGRSNEPATAPYRFATIERGEITASVRATGTLNPLTTILVGSQLSGQVVEILTDYNSPVKKGQIMARIFSDQIKTRCDAARADLQQAEADVTTRRAQLEKSKATLAKANASLVDVKAKRDRSRAELADAQRTLVRQKELFSKGAGAQTALDTAQTQTDIQIAASASAEAQIILTEADIDSLKADVDLADAQLLSAQATVLQRKAKLADIEIDLYRTDIRSPVDGVVVKKDVELGQTVAASLSAPTLFTVAQDLREIDIYANIDEADVGQLKEGQPVKFTVSAFPDRSFKGTVRMVRLEAQNIQNVVTYIAVIGVKNTDLTLLPGMTANVEIVTEHKLDVLRIPNAALRFRPTTPAPDAQPRASTSRSAQASGTRPFAQAKDGETVGSPGRVFVLNEKGEPQPIAVRLGIGDGSMTELLSPLLSAGTQVIVGGGSKDDPSQAAPRRGPRMF